jgi:hypothetical protein
MAARTFEWYSDVSGERPIWRQLTRNGVTVDYLEFDGSGQRLKTNLSEPVEGTMVHVTTQGTFRVEVSIPAGVYEYRPYQSLWNIEEFILFDRTLTDSEYAFFLDELKRNRNRKIEIDQTDWSELFYGRPEVDINSVVPLLSANDQVTSFGSTFRENSLTSIPAGLFDNNPNVTTFGGTFRDNNLKSIPAGLFDNNVNVTSFSATFRENSLTSIPAGLFDNNVNVTSFSATFIFNNLTSIPPGLFDNNVNATIFLQTFSFNNLTSIPAGLFSNLSTIPELGSSAITGSGTFESNSIESVPEDIFNNIPNASGIVEIESIFHNNNITNIPANIFSSLTSLEKVGRVFNNNQITSIPESLFANNPNLKYISQPDSSRDNRSIFGDNQIGSIPENLFVNNPDLVELPGGFAGNNLTSVPAGLFATPINIRGFAFAFAFQNNSITTVPAGVFDTQTQATNYDRVFNNNALDQTSVDNVLVSIAFSARGHDLNDGIIGIDGGTNAPAPYRSCPPLEELVMRDWTVNLNGQNLADTTINMLADYYSEVSDPNDDSGDYSFVSWNSATDTYTQTLYSDPDSEAYSIVTWDSVNDTYDQRIYA